MHNPSIGQYGVRSWAQSVPAGRRKRTRIAPDDTLVTCYRSQGDTWVQCARVPNTKAVRRHLAATPGNYRLVAHDGRIVWRKVPITSLTGKLPATPVKVENQRMVLVFDGTGASVMASPATVSTRDIPAPTPKWNPPAGHGRIERAMNAARSLNV
jgi:hypothetical protein